MASEAQNRVALPRVAFLDGLRGIAALLVVFCHATAAVYPHVVFGGTDDGPSHLLYGVPILNLPFQGNFMVCVFFALSGFALSYHTIGRRERGPALSALVRRYPRLMVPVFCGIMLGAGLLALNLFPVQEAASITGSTWWGSYWQFAPSLGSALYAGTIGVFRQSTGFPPYDPPLWTMHNELIGSLLVFGVLLALSRRWMRVGAYVVLAWLTFDSYLLAFVGGMAICEIWMARPSLPRWSTWAMLPVGIYGLVLGSFPIPSPTLPAFYSNITPGASGGNVFDQQVHAHVIGGILVVAAVVAIIPAQRALQWRPVLFLGRVSFALYILHFLVLSSLGAGLVIHLDGRVPYWTIAVSMFAAVVVVSIATAWVLTRLVDEPTVSALGRGYRSAAAWVDGRRHPLVDRSGPGLVDAAPTIERSGP